MGSSKLSVIMSNYNHAPFLPRSVQGILDQSYRPAEFVIIDDGSTDNSVEVLQKFAQKNSVIRLIIKQQNQGCLAHFQEALSLTSGNYLYFASADDKALPGLFERSMRLLTQFPEAAFCSALSKIVDDDGKIANIFPMGHISRTARYFSPGECLGLLRRKVWGWASGNTVIIRRDALIWVGGLLPELHAFCDGFMYMVLARRYGACFIPAILGLSRQTPESYSDRCVSNLPVATEMWGKAAHLLRTKYSTLFPADFVDSWERQKLYHARLSAINRLQVQQLNIMKGFWTNPSRSDRIFSWGLRALYGFQFYLLMAYLLARLPRDIWPILGHGLRGLAQRLRLRWQQA